MKIPRISRGVDGVTKRERIGVLALYAGDGYIDKYKYVLIESLTVYFEKFIVVINGKASAECVKNIKLYVDEVFSRPNMGYDIGAYKDTLLNYLCDEDWRKWKELVLLNDTFYGPLNSWNHVFSIMEERENDFWGLGEHLGGKYIAPHIQSFFTAYKQNILLSPIFWDFWRGLRYPKTRKEAIEGFELSFTGAMKKQGFLEDSYMRAFGSKFTLQYGRSAYLSDAYELVRDIKFPIVKFRLFSPVYYEEAEKVLQYIKNNCDYDLKLIYVHIDRLEKAGEIRPFGEKQLNQFYHAHNNIYIFGHGQYGKNLEKFFAKKGWNISSFVTTEGNAEEGILSLNELKMEADDGLIIALGEQNLQEVYPELSRRIAAQQMLW